MIVRNAVMDVFIERSDGWNAVMDVLIERSDGWSAVMEVLIEQCDGLRKWCNVIKRVFHVFVLATGTNPGPFVPTCAILPCLAILPCQVK